jgi:hypothetical protein
MPTPLPIGVILVYDTYKRIGPPGTKVFHGLVRARNAQGAPAKVLWECDHDHSSQADARACSFSKCKANAHRWRWYL